MSENISDILYKTLNESEDPDDFSGNETPQCPHCGYFVSFEAMLDHALYEEGKNEITCELCGIDYEVYTAITFTYSTHEQSNNILLRIREMIGLSDPNISLTDLREKLNKHNRISNMSMKEMLNYIDIIKNEESQE